MWIMASRIIEIFSQIGSKINRSRRSNPVKCQCHSECQCSRQLYFALLSHTLTQLFAIYSSIITN